MRSRLSNVSRRTFLAAACVAAVVVRRSALAQALQGRRVRVAFLGAATPEGYAVQVAALRAGLRDYGYVEGRNLTLEFRWAEGRYERLGPLAMELVASTPDVIVTHATPGTRAAMRATSTIPIVMATNGDAVAQGLIANLAQPGGNVTGSTFLQPELMTKRIELLQAARPRVRRVAILLNPANPTRESLFRDIESSADALGVSIEAIDVERRQDLSRAFLDIARRKLEAVVVRDDAMYIAAAEEIANLALAHKLPSAGFKELAERGGLIGYGVNFAAMFRRVGYFVDRLVKGTPPSAIPVEQARSFELVVNVRSARVLRLTLPMRVLMRADRLIE